MINLLFLLVGISFAQIIPLPDNYKCPTPKNRISPKVDVKIDYQSKTRTYLYNYTLANLSAPLPINFLYLYVFEAPLTVKSPKSTSDEPLEQWRPYPLYKDSIAWSTPGEYIYPSKKRGGFQISSYYKPGIIKYSASGFNDDDPHVDAECPDHFQDLPAEQSEIVAATIGPVPDSLNQVDGELDFESKKHSGKIPQIDPLDKGEVEVYLKDSDNFEIADVDVASFEFGPGKAKVKRHKFINENGKECSSHDFRRKHKKRKLKLVFKLEDIKVRCNLDYALFLHGKVGGKNLLAAQEMKPVVCEPKHFSKK
ncbi:hypothetical protein K2X05_09025 [bacterium]|nr:hypothetical protein [bacterium]